MALRSKKNLASNSLAKKSFSKRFAIAAKNNWQLYLLLALPIVYMFIFHYYPMYGAQIAFRDFKPKLGIWGSEWVGFEHFIRFVKQYDFVRIIENTLVISIYSLIAGMPFPIILALLLKHIPYRRFGKIVQSITYAPHFISVVVMCGIIMRVLDPRTGMVNNILGIFGIDYSIDLMASKDAFSSIYVWSGVWQGTGFAAIIYIAILAGVDTSLHEAAMVDGASIWKRMWHIDIPALIPQITLSLILSLGNILNVGFEKVLLLQNSVNGSKAEIIATYVYKMGFQATMPNHSYVTAMGLFQSIISLILIVIVNKIAQKWGEISLW